MAIEKRNDVPNYISLKVCDELYALVALQSDLERIPMIDIATRALAKEMGRPDLAYVPRKTSKGRPRTKALVGVGENGK